MRTCHSRSRLTRFSLALLVFPAVLAVTTEAMALDAQEVAMITDVQGSCTIDRTKRKLPCELFGNLAVGDEIAVPRGSRLVIAYYRPSQEYTLAGDTRATVSEVKLQVSSGPAAVHRQLAGGPSGGNLQNWNRTRDVAGGLVVRGSERRKIILLSPAGTVLRRPTEFRWKLRGEADKPEVQFGFILQEESGLIVLETLVNGPFFSLPKEVRLREGGSYIWEVTMRQANRKGYAAVGEFMIADAALRKQAERLQPSSGASFSERLLHAVTLEEMGLLEEARPYWAALAIERPDSAELRRLAGQGVGH